jgi:hypothetical protein
MGSSPGLIWFQSGRQHHKVVFDVSLTAHLSIILANDQPDAQILIYLLHSSTYTCFEQYLAHPKEVKIVLIQHLVSFTESDDTKCCINTI